MSSSSVLEVIQFDFATHLGGFLNAWPRRPTVVERISRAGSGGSHGPRSGSVDLAYRPAKVCPNAELPEPEGKRVVSE